MASRFCEALEAMGLRASLKRSRRSASAYVTVRGDGDADPVLVRVSNHPLPAYYRWQNGAPDYDIRSPRGLYRVVRQLAARFGAPVPQKYAAEAEAAAVARGSRGAAARWANEFQRARAAVVAELERDARNGFAGRLPLLRDLAEQHGITVKRARKIILALKLARAEGRAGRWTSVLEFLRSNADRLHLGNW